MADNSTDFAYDVFISYAHDDETEMNMIACKLQEMIPGIRLFIDKQELTLGALWQRQLFEAIDESHVVICLLSPSYIRSSVCIDEYNIAFFRHRRRSRGVLLPVYLKTAQLPTYMELLQYEDIRKYFHTEGDMGSSMVNAITRIANFVRVQTDNAMAGRRSSESETS